MHKFDPKNIERLLKDDRYKEIDPEGLLSESGVEVWQTFADVGCGPGFFTFAASELVGPSGTVLAIDTQEGMLDALRERNPPGNVQVIKSEENKIPVKSGICDFALLAYVLHEASDPAALLAEIKRILNPGGKLLLIDWKKIKEEHGPPIEERIEQEKALALVTAAGYHKAKASELNSSQYRILAYK